MARRSKRPRRLPKQLPQKIHELVAAGGPKAVARNAAADAARQEMEFWLKLLERIKQEDLDTRGRMMCSRYIRNPRRKLGIRPSKEEIREQTRSRVRRFRERAKSLRQK
jgi:hypothetical protein